MLSIQISIHLDLLEPDKLTNINVNWTTKKNLISIMLSIQISIHLSNQSADFFSG